MGQQARSIAAALIDAQQLHPPQSKGIGRGLGLALAKGHRPGQILTERRGDGGLGYAPVFYMPGAGPTFTEVDASIKTAA